MKIKACLTSLALLLGTSVAQDNNCPQDEYSRACPTMNLQTEYTTGINFVYNCDSWLEAEFLATYNDVGNPWQCARLCAGNKECRGAGWNATAQSCSLTASKEWQTVDSEKYPDSMYIARDGHKVKDCGPGKYFSFGQCFDYGEVACDKGYHFEDGRCLKD